MASMQGKTGGTDSNLNAWLVAVLACLGGLSLSVALSVATGSFHQRQLEQRFAWAASERAAAMQASFSAHVADLDGTRRFFINADEVTFSEFAGYAGGLLNRTLSYAWLPRVEAAQRDSFEAQARAAGYPGFTIRDLTEQGTLQPAASRAEHFPVRYLVPIQTFDAVLGLDMNSQQARRETLERARHNGFMATSGVIRFVAASAADRDGLLLMAPIFRGSQPLSGSPLPAQSLRGFVVAFLSLHQLLEDGGSAQSERNLSLEVHDTSRLSGEALHYRSPAPAADSPLLLRRELQLADRRYELSIRPTAAFLAANSNRDQAILLTAGVLLSLLLGVLLFTLVSQRQRARSLVAQRTLELRSRERELAISEQRWSFALDGAGDGVWDWDLDRDRIFLSDSCTGMLGYSADEIGDDRAAWQQLLHPDDLPACLQALQLHLQGQTEFFRHEYRMRCRDGAWKWILGRGKVMERAADGRPLRIIGTQSDIRWRKAAELELARVNAYLHGILDAATQVAIIATDLDGTIRTFNAGAERMLGYSAEELVGQATPERLHLREEIDQRSRELSLRYGKPINGFEAFVAVTQAEKGHDEREWTYVRRDGSRLVVNLIVTSVRDESGELIGFLGIAADITERRRVRQVLEERDRRMEMLMASVPGAIYQYRRQADGSSSFPYASAGIRAIYEIEPEVLRSDASSVFARIHPDDFERVSSSIRVSAEQLQPWCQDYRVLLPVRGLRWLRGEATPEALADGGVLWHGYLTDITGLKLVEQELRALSITDALTGVHNRRYFQERLEAEIARVQRFGGELSVVMLDIDHFKQINDRFGHEAGDRVLKALCERLRQRLRGIDVFCRLGGEEFIVLCPSTSAAQAMALASSLWQVLRSEPVEGVGRVSASFGVASWRPGEGADGMLRRVDSRVYAAKQAGRDQVLGEPD
ncbi:hypothetical protein A9179_08825 [Pseudomonas alcaligenes]|uniref:Diguanylate cyclase n=2 Tax=Aquipseudomonas alcaligenes TaxID=43263 RepID=A0ABR7S026_AQUAC|nr:hypothetical protein [Pseudomonas alcaligenes]